jgi:hypothetical protein
MTQVTKGKGNRTGRLVLAIAFVEPGDPGREGFHECVEIGSFGGVSSNPYVRLAAPSSCTWGFLPNAVKRTISESRVQIMSQKRMRFASLYFATAKLAKKPACGLVSHNF